MTINESNEQLDPTKCLTDQVWLLGDEKYGGGFECWDRAAEIFRLEKINLPDEQFLKGVDWSDPKQVLLELQRAYAGGWAIGEDIASTFITFWIRTRGYESTRKTLADMAANVELETDEEKFRVNWQRFYEAPELAQLILDLPLPPPNDEPIEFVDERLDGDETIAAPMSPWPTIAKECTPETNLAEQL